MCAGFRNLIKNLQRRFRAFEMASDTLKIGFTKLNNETHYFVENSMRCIKIVLLNV